MLNQKIATLVFDQALLKSNLPVFDLSQDLFEFGKRFFEILGGCLILLGHWVNNRAGDQWRPVSAATCVLCYDAPRTQLFNGDVLERSSDDVLSGNCDPSGFGAGF